MRIRSTSVFIPWSNTAQGHDDSSRMVAAQREMEEQKSDECLHLFWQIKSTAVNTKLVIKYMSTYCVGETEDLGNMGC